MDYLFRKGIQTHPGKTDPGLRQCPRPTRASISTIRTARGYIDEDYNRVWGDDALLGPRDSANCGARANCGRSWTRRLPARPALHARALPADHGLRQKREERAFSRRIGVPGDLLIDTGHPAGLRMIERGGFGEPSSAKTAVLIECGQHWEKSAPTSLWTRCSASCSLPAS